MKQKTQALPSHYKKNDKLKQLEQDIRDIEEIVADKPEWRDARNTLRRYKAFHKKVVKAILEKIKKEKKKTKKKVLKSKQEELTHITKMKNRRIKK